LYHLPWKLHREDFTPGGATRGAFTIKSRSIRSTDQAAGRWSPRQPCQRELSPLSSRQPRPQCRLGLPRRVAPRARRACHLDHRGPARRR
jgi:hypothetical protein